MKYFWYRVAATLACLATIAATYITLLFFSNSFSASDPEGTFIGWGVLILLWLVSAVIGLSTFMCHEDMHMYKAAVMFAFGPIALTGFFIQKILNGMPLNSDRHAKDLKLNWPGIVNRTIGLIVLAIEITAIVYCTNWAQGKVPPEVNWHWTFQWLATLSAIWCFSIAVHCCTYGQHLYKAPGVEFFQLCLGPIWVVPMLIWKIIDGEPVNHDRTNMDPKPLPKVPFFVQK